MHYNYGMVVCSARWIKMQPDIEIFRETIIPIP